VQATIKKPSNTKDGKSSRKKLSRMSIPKLLKTSKKPSVPRILFDCCKSFPTLISLLQSHWSIWIVSSFFNLFIVNHVQKIK
jgi:hypothetical protein